MVPTWLPLFRPQGLPRVGKELLSGSFFPRSCLLAFSLSFALYFPPHSQTLYNLVGLRLIILLPLSLRYAFLPPLDPLWTPFLVLGTTHTQSVSVLETMTRIRYWRRQGSEVMKNQSPDVSSAVTSHKITAGLYNGFTEAKNFHALTMQLG